MKAAKKKKTTSGKSLDPLYVIFEQHLFNFADPDSDRRTFITTVVTDYLTYLRKNNVIVPKSLEQPIYEELGAQVNTMLVKKIYGCLDVSDYQDTVPALVKKKARTRYAKVKGVAKKKTAKKSTVKTVAVARVKPTAVEKKTG